MAEPLDMFPGIGPGGPTQDRPAIEAAMANNAPLDMSAQQFFGLPRGEQDQPSPDQPSRSPSSKRTALKHRRNGRCRERSPTLVHAAALSKLR
jgi:hypothetical protein